jgi:hypothetical protein
MLSRFLSVTSYGRVARIISYIPKGKLLIFSTLVNNHQASATEIRKAVEKFIQGIRLK